MPSYFKPVRYEKKVEKEAFFKNRNFYFWGNSTIFPVLPFVIAGILVVSQIVVPLYFFKAKEKIPVVAEKSVLGYSTGYRAFEFDELAQDAPLNQNLEKPKYFYVTIPKLNIQSALVEADSVNLSPDDAIGHYKGSAHPGNDGTVYLYGHSVLPVFYNPRNYKTIFSKLDELETGDEILVDYKGSKFVYRVWNSETLSVKDVNPLKSKQISGSTNTLVLMTCWPAGTKAKRFEVVAIQQE